MEGRRELSRRAGVFSRRELAVVRPSLWKPPYQASVATKVGESPPAGRKYGPNGAPRRQSIELVLA
jgi:hypothetical protein